MNIAYNELGSIFRDNPEISVTVGQPNGAGLLGVHRQIDPESRESVIVYTGMISVLRYHAGKPATHADLMIGSLDSNNAGNLTWRDSEDQLGIEVEDIINLARLGLKVEHLYRGVGFLFLDRFMPEVKSKLTDLVNSHGQMHVSPKYQTTVENGCDRMRLLFGV